MANKMPPQVDILLSQSSQLKLVRISKVFVMRIRQVYEAGCYHTQFDVRLGSGMKISPGASHSSGASHS